MPNKWREKIKETEGIQNSNWLAYEMTRDKRLRALLDGMMAL